MKLWKTALAAGGLAIIGLVPVHADNNEALFELLKALHENGTIDGQTYEAIRQVAERGKQERQQETRETVQAEVRKQVAEEVKTATADQPQINTKGKFEITSPDGDFKVRLGGRIQADYAAYDDDEADLGSGSEIRRARLFMSGTLWRVWDYKFQYDFTDSGADGIQDAYIAYQGLAPASFKAGNFKEPYSLENITSSKHVTFIERALPEVFRPGRNLGAQAATHGNNWSAALGVFGESVGTSPDSSSSESGTEVDEGVAVTGRVTWAPLLDDRRLIHLGAAGSYRNLDQRNELRLRQRPESNITGVRLVDTGDINADSFALAGAEGAVLLGPLHVQAEYMRMQVERAGMPGSDLGFDGYYGEIGYFLTGEMKNYDVSDGSFGRLTPNSIVGRGGIGAWQLAARFSNLDLNDEDIAGGEEENVTVGMNWWPTPNLRFSANYTRVLDVDGGPNADDEPSFFAVRSQVEF